MAFRKSRFGRLVGHFFAGFLDNDLLSSAGAGMQNALSQAVALIVTPGLFYCLLCFWKYGSMADRVRGVLAWEDRLLFLHWSMVLTGFLTVIEWDTLFPDRRDYQVLGPLPLTARTVFLAKLCSVLLLLVIFWGAANLGPALLFPAAAINTDHRWFALPQNMAAHLAATLAGSSFVFLTLMGLQGVLLNVLRPRWFRRASVFVQLAAVLMLMLLFLGTPLLVSRAIPWIRADHGVVYAVPSFWFTGLYQVMIGESSAAFPRLAWIALMALGITAAASGMAYFASYQRFLKRSLESEGTLSSEPGWLAEGTRAVLQLFFLRHPIERGWMLFISATLRRSRIHRLLLAAYLAAAFAVAFGAVASSAPDLAAGRPTPALLSVQLVLTFFALCGIRFVFALPANLEANWAFQATDPRDKTRCGIAARKAMLALGVIPVLAALLPLHALLWGLPMAAGHLLIGGAAAALLIEVLLAGFDKIPFTCTYLPGRANVKALWPVYLAMFWAYAYAMAKLEFKLLTHPGWFLFVCLAATAAVAVCWRQSRRRYVAGFRFRFEDLPEPAVRTLDIGNATTHESEHAEFPAALPPEAPLPRISEWLAQRGGELRSDFRYAGRTLAQNPGFALTGALILAAAVGANTLLFTFFNALVLKPLPMAERQRNVEVTGVETSLRPHDNWSHADFTQLRADNQAFEDLYAWSSVEIQVRKPSTRTLRGVVVSGNFFGIFEGSFALGRPFGPQEDQTPGRDPVVVLSHHTWKALFHADPKAAGATLRVGQTLFTIVGVTGPEFTGTDPLTVPDFWAPLAMTDQLLPQGRPLADPENAFLRVAGLLKPGIPPARAREMTFRTIAALNAQHPADSAIQTVALHRRATYVPLAGKTLLVTVCTFGLFGLILLIACANLAGVLLARGTARQREIAIRASLGAPRGRLVRQLLTESILLGGMAALPGLVLTQACAGLIHRYLFTLLIRDGYAVPPIGPDWRVFGFGIAAALAAGILLGFSPALEATRADLCGALKECGAGGGPMGGPRRVREWLVSGQVAASFVLMVLAAIFVRNAQRMEQIDPGFDAAHAIEVRTEAPKPALIRKLKEDPRFEAASEVYRTPLRGWLAWFPVKANGRVWPLSYNYVESDYFETLRIPILLGRNFTPDEARAQSPVALVSEAGARLLWPGEDPAGKTFEVLPAQKGERHTAGNYTVIGVVPDVIGGMLYIGKDLNNTFYLPARSGDPRNGAVVVRSKDPGPGPAAAIRKICTGMEGTIACEATPLRELAWKQRFPHAVASNVSSALGLMALGLTCVGIYGMVAYAVVQRTREIGIRMALGAKPSRVLRSLMMRTMQRVGLGVAMGIPVCLALSKIMTSAVMAPKTIQMFDPGAYIAAPLVLAAVTAAAVYVPARRATRIDPIAALRQE